jgi:hypothetical protein
MDIRMQMFYPSDPSSSGSSPSALSLDTKQQQQAAGMLANGRRVLNLLDQLRHDGLDQQGLIDALAGDLEAAKPRLTVPISQVIS